MFGQAYNDKEILHTLANYHTPRLCSVLCKHASKKRCECQCDGLYHGRGFEFSAPTVARLEEAQQQEYDNWAYQPTIRTFEDARV